MKIFLFAGVTLLTACNRAPEAVAWKPVAEPARESVIEFVQKMSSEEVAKEAEPYRTWLIAQRTGICELHHAKMYRQWIPVAYGLPMAGSLPEAEDSARFPHGEEYWLGGCVVTATKEREVYLCPECVSACRDWRGKKKPNQLPEPLSGLAPGRGSS